MAFKFLTVNLMGKKARFRFWHFDIFIWIILFVLTSGLNTKSKFLADSLITKLATSLINFNEILFIFCQQLSSIYEGKPPISKAKMAAITRYAVKALKVCLKFHFIL